MLAVKDLKYRLVPRLWAGGGFAVQWCWLIAFAAAERRWAPLMAAFCGCAACTAAQFALALARPGMLGLGDITATALVALPLGWFGWRPLVAWWLYVGILALAWLPLWTAVRHVALWCAAVRTDAAPGSKQAKRNAASSVARDGVPFVPVLVGAMWLVLARRSI